jgi:ethanolamine transporter EutH
MGGRAWLWVGIALDLIILPPAFYMAIEAIEIVSRSDRSPMAIGIAVLFFALPVFCLAAPLAAWRARRNRRHPAHVAALLAAPIAYAAFLVIFLLT